MKINQIHTGYGQNSHGHMQFPQCWPMRAFTNTSVLLFFPWKNKINGWPLTKIVRVLGGQDSHESYVHESFSMDPCTHNTRPVYEYRFEKCPFPIIGRKQKVSILVRFLNKWVMSSCLRIVSRVLRKFTKETTSNVQNTLKFIQHLPQSHTYIFRR